MKLYQTIAISLIALTLTGNAFADGDHAHENSASAGVSTNTCTPEHEAMGHCKMEQADGVGHHAHMESAVGKPAEASEATKTVEVSLLDEMKFEFAELSDIQDGDIVKFTITNKGKLAHEFSIGDEQEQEAHRKMMQQMPDMKHEDGNTVTVQPGESKELTWQFSGPNQVVFACNVPGYFEAGMHHEVEIK